MSPTMNRLLRWASVAPSKGWDGIIAMTPGEGTALRALERRGLVRNVGFVGGEFEGERIGWEITEDGKAQVSIEDAAEGCRT